VSPIRLVVIFASILALCPTAVPLAGAQSSNQKTGDASGASSSQSQPSQPSDLPGAQQPPPKPGDLGWPFPNEHWWNRIAAEAGGGYSPVISQGNGFYASGFHGFGGLIDRATPRLDLLLEFQIFGQQTRTVPLYGLSSNTTTIPSFDLAALYLFRPHETTGIYVIGGPGFYRLVAGVNCPPTAGCLPIPPANREGFFGGVGVRHRIVAGKETEIFFETRYHYIASDPKAFGLISLMPVDGGIRW
jgi:hypothetical protein